MSSLAEVQIDERWAPQVEVERLRRAAERTLELEALEPGHSLTVAIVGDEEMVRMHEAFRGEARPTDVLSFPYDASAPDPDNEMDRYLGDVVISYPQAARQAEDGGHSVQDELDLLVVHGALHLLGYDDEVPEAKKEMWDRQQRVLEALGLAAIAPDA